MIESLIIFVVLIVFVIYVISSVSAPIFSKWFFAHLLGDADDIEDIEDKVGIYLESGWGKDNDNTSYEQNIKKPESNSTIARKNAIKKASAFIKVYNKDIWHNQDLSNQFCRLYLGQDGISISVFDKSDPTYSRYFEIISPQKHADLWNKFCYIFNENLTYENLIKYCQEQGIGIQIYGDKKIILEEMKEQAYEKNIKKEISQEKNPIMNKTKHLNERNVDL